MRIPLCTALLCSLSLSLAAQEKGVAPASLEDKAQTAVAEQRWADAIASWRKLTEVRPDYGRAWHMLGYSLHAAGKLDEALKIHLKAVEFPEIGATAAYNAACVYSLKGDLDKAFEWLGKAADAGFAGATHMAGDTDMDPLRDDPRYQEVLARIEENEGEPGAVQVFAMTTPRSSTRMFYWSGGSSPGQVRIDYGTPEWKASYDDKIGSEEFAGRRWRLGQNFWTNLDSNRDLEIGGVEIPAGYYYLTAQRTADGEFLLGVHDPAQVRKYTLDAYQAHMVKGGLDVPLEHETVDRIADELSIRLKAEPETPTEAVLEIRFGPHRLSAPIRVALGS